MPTNQEQIDALHWLLNDSYETARRASRLAPASDREALLESITAIRRHVDGMGLTHSIESRA